MRLGKYKGTLWAYALGYWREGPAARALAAATRAVPAAASAH